MDATTTVNITLTEAQAQQAVSALDKQITLILGSRRYDAQAKSDYDAAYAARAVIHRELQRMQGII